MPGDERHNGRLGNGEAWKSSPGSLDDGDDDDAFVDVHVATHRSPRKASTQSNAASTRIDLDDVAMDVDPESLSTATPAVAFSKLFGRSSWFTQAFSFAFSEGGMSLVTGAVLLLLSLTGFVTMYGISPSRTTVLMETIKEHFFSTPDDTTELQLNRLLPDAARLLQAGLQVMVVPAMLVSSAGIYVLSNPDRRRPGKWLVVYGGVAFLLGLALLYLFIRVSFDGQLKMWEDNVTLAVEEVWRNIDPEVPGAVCAWEKHFPCSGRTICCVTNTTEVGHEVWGDKEENVMPQLCFLTVGSDNRAELQNGTDVTDVVRQQCGDAPPSTTGSELPPLTTWCSSQSISTNAATPATQMMTCPDYLSGQLTSPLGYALCLLLGMAVCSLVSGVVALVSNLQRTRTSDFVLVGSIPSNAAKESAAAAKGDYDVDGRAVGRKYH